MVESGNQNYQGSSMATFSVVPHLITVSDFGGVTRYH
jgi:hypothetical protein